VTPFATVERPEIRGFKADLVVVLANPGRNLSAWLMISANPSQRLV
jgi:hypothetical protein